MLQRWYIIETSLHRYGVHSNIAEFSVLSVETYKYKLLPLLHLHL